MNTLLISEVVRQDKNLVLKKIKRYSFFFQNLVVSLTNRLFSQFDLLTYKIKISFYLSLTPPSESNSIIDSLFHSRTVIAKVTLSESKYSAIPKSLHLMISAFLHLPVFAIPHFCISYVFGISSTV